ncbi:NmrA-like family domain-containing protein 1 [Pleurostoma richardsiae]|uniref:NmrA-like family domain-containing protein 1 n=1 Tax=Pleurostoma richardsiae TaxID=41990 RepID=A0AA38RQC0_9PEZI|nr:NmrA-like family domain-containing protein 1 [Pleurostoma richardsiae]
MSKLIVVTGITGVQGGSVADVYLQTPGWEVRGVSRDPSSAASQAWAAKGIEIVKGDLNDAASLAAAFAGADAVFGVTDFWTVFGDPASESRRRPGQSLIQYCYEVELQQGRNLADAAATVPGLSRFVLSSMADAARWSKGKFSELYHMDSKAKAADYAQGLPELKKKFSQVQAPIYYNLLWQWGLPTTPKKQPDGTYRVKGVGSGDIPIPFGDVRKDFGYNVRAAVEAEPGLNLFAVGEEMTWNQYLKTWCESQNVPFGGYDEVSYEDFLVLLPGGLGHEFGQNVLFAQEFGYDGSDPSAVRPDAFGIKMTTFREYCDATDFSAIL